MELHRFFLIFEPKCTGGDPMVLLQRKTYFSKDPEGVQPFPGGGGVSIFQGKGASKYLFL